MTIERLPGESEAKFYARRIAFNRKHKKSIDEFEASELLDPESLAIARAKEEREAEQRRDSAFRKLAAIILIVVAMFIALLGAAVVWAWKAVL